MDSEAYGTGILLIAGGRHEQRGQGDECCNDVRRRAVRQAEENVGTVPMSSASVDSPNAKPVLSCSRDASAHSVMGIVMLNSARPAMAAAGTALPRQGRAAKRAAI